MPIQNNFAFYIPDTFQKEKQNAIYNIYLMMSQNPLEQQKRKLRYPTLNMNYTSRVSNQRVNNSRIALMRYKEQILIHNTAKSNDAQIVEPRFLQKFQKQDGMIFTFKNYQNNQDLKISGQNDQNKKQHIGDDPFHLGVKILVCICMYNESQNAIRLTLEGIYRNLQGLQSQNISANDIAVVLVQDGILKLVSDKVKRKYQKGEKSMIKFYEKLDRAQGKRTCDLIQRINIILDQTQNYQRKGMKEKVNNNKEIPPSIQKNIALVYQNLWWPKKTSQDSKVEQQFQKKYSIRLFSCFKHTNGTKLSSHLLFFEGFCRYLNPQFCVLLDVGTTPKTKGLVNLIRGFKQERNIGGVSGFMSVDSDFPSQEAQANKKHQQSCCNQQCIRNNKCMDAFCSIERAQQYQYIISHFIDKNQESTLGFLHVLPGAWSAYRYEALIKSDKYEPNLLQKSYFKMILTPNFQQKDYAEANMYLAQDRILSLGIYCQMNQKYVLRYIPDAHADTDPMKDHQNLMNQRRRWINSSMFAFLYAYKNYYYNVMDSKHNFCRRYITLNISMLIALISTFNAYITPAIYFFVLYSTIYQLKFTGAEWVAKLACLIYVMVFFAGIAGSLTGKTWSKRAHIISFILGIYTIILTFTVFYNILIIYLKVVDNPWYTPPQGQTRFKFDLSGNDGIVVVVIIMLVANIFFYWFTVFMHIPTHLKSVWKILADTPSYLAYTAAYSQTMVIHAFCNVDDVSWGTKGSGAAGVNKFQADKVFFVGNWILVNTILAFIFLYIDIITVENGATNKGGVVLIALAVYGTVFFAIKAILAIVHHFKWMFCIKCCNKGFSPERKQIVQQYWRKQNQDWLKDHQNNLMKKRNYRLKEDPFKIMVTSNRVII